MKTREMSGFPNRISVLRPFSAFRFSLFAFLSVLAFPLLAAPPAPTISVPDRSKPKPLEITDALRDYCKLIYACGLKVSSGTCPAPADLGPPAPYSPESDRCKDARAFAARGVGPEHPFWGFRLYRFMGFEYRTTYEIADTLPVSRARLEYLIGDVPLAAKLVSHYQEEKYTAEWVDFERTHFKGTNGKRLRGEAKRITGSFAEGRLYYMGSGTAEWGFWTLYGPAMMDFQYHEVPGKSPRVAYRLKILVAPGNGVVNSIMNLGLFRGLVQSKITSVLSDISQASRKLDSTGGKDLAGDNGWSPAEKKKIETLLKLE
jgi:hypothetical protein